MWKKLLPDVKWFLRCNLRMKASQPHLGSVSFFCSTLNVHWRKQASFLKAKCRNQMLVTPQKKKHYEVWFCNGHGAILTKHWMLIIPKINVHFILMSFLWNVCPTPSRRGEKEGVSLFVLNYNPSQQKRRRLNRFKIPQFRRFPQKKNILIL